MCLWGVPGMPPGSPTDPKRHQKLGKRHKKGTVAALRAALLDYIILTIYQIYDNY